MRHVPAVPALFIALVVFGLAVLLTVPLAAQSPAGVQGPGRPGPQSASLGAIPVMVPGKKVPSVGFNPRLERLTRVACIRDTSKVLDCDGVLSLMTQGKFEILDLDGIRNFGFTPPVIWLVFQISNETEMGSNSFLEVGENDLEHIDVYMRRTLADGTVRVTVERGGSSVPFNNRPMRLGAHVFNAIAPPASISTVFCRIEHRGLARVSLMLLPAPAIFPRLEAQTQVFSLLIGGLLVLMLINAFLFLAMRESIFLWFVLHVLFILGYALAASGQADRLLWPGTGGLQSVGTMIFAMLLICTGLLFSRRLLSTERISRGFNRYLGWLAVAGGVLVVLFWFLRDHLRVPLGIFLGVSFVSLMFAGIRSLRAGQENSRAFLVAWGLLLLGVSIRQMVLLEIMPRSGLSGFLSTMDYGGLMAEVLVFTFWLIWSLHQLKAQKEEAIAKNRQRQSFIANISHEMRTPLNAIMGISEALQGSTSMREVKAANRQIHQESTRLLFQINQVLDLAKLDADRFQLENRDFRPREIGDYLSAAYQPMAKAKGLALKFNFNHGEDLLLRGDPGRIEQVLRNLLDNAIKFTESGEVEVSFIAQDFSAGLVRAGWSVRDTGPGIAAEKQAEIFEEFVQADSSITRRFGGTGLGTSIARKLVQVMGGELQLESRPGNGARFSFSLTLPRGHEWHPAERLADTMPLDTGEAGKADEGCNDDSGCHGAINVCAQMEKLCSTPCPACSEAPVEKKQPLILVVDDYETNIQVVLLQLKKVKVDIHTASNGEVALEKLENNHYDLVLLDVFMPGLSGYDVVQAMSARPEWSSIPVIGLTASGYEDDIKAALNAGMRSVLVKPVARQDLLGELEKFLPSLKE